MFIVYIIQRKTTGRHYIGVTADLNDQLRRHNTGNNKSTKHGAPWEIVYTETFTSKEHAWKREQQIKRYKGGEAFKKLLS